MSYYYQTHLRNLQEEVILQRKKIEAELHEKKILQQSKPSSLEIPTPKKIRLIEDQETAAYLERSRLSSELSALRSKAQASMNRSRLESAFQLRKENQKAMEEMEKMQRKHLYLLNRSEREEFSAKLNLIQSQRQAEDAYLREEALLNLSQRERKVYEQEKQIAERVDFLLRRRYDNPYYY